MYVCVRARIPLVSLDEGYHRGQGEQQMRRLQRREGYDEVDDNDRSRELLTKLDGLVTIIPRTSKKTGSRLIVVVRARCIAVLVAPALLCT